MNTTQYRPARNSAFPNFNTAVTLLSVRIGHKMSPVSVNIVIYATREARSFVKIVTECGYNLRYINSSSNTTNVFNSYQHTFSSSLLHISTVYSVSFSGQS